MAKWRHVALELEYRKNNTPALPALYFPSMTNLILLIQKQIWIEDYNYICCVTAVFLPFVFTFVDSLMVLFSGVLLYLLLIMISFELNKISLMLQCWMHSLLRPNMKHLPIYRYNVCNDSILLAIEMDSRSLPRCS